MGYLRGIQRKPSEARACLSRGAELLHGVGDKASLGLLLSQRVQVEYLAGERQQATATLEEAERLAIEVSPTPDSEFGLALDLARSHLAYFAFGP